MVGTRFILQFTFFTIAVALVMADAEPKPDPESKANPDPDHPLPHHAPHHPPPPPHHPLPHHPPHHPTPHGHYCDPKAPPPCALHHEVPFCIEDPDYPVYEIAEKISRDPIFLKKYSDVADQSADDLVDYISSYQEHSLHYNYYTGASKGPSPYDVSHWIGPEGYLCPSNVDYVKIRRAVNVEGNWRVILQHIPKDYGYGHYNYTQTTRLEACLTPDSACRLLAPCYGSKCTQKYVYHRMLSYDPCDPYRGFFIDTYKLPSACSCHIPQYHPAPHPAIHPHPTPVPHHPLTALPVKKT